MKSPTKKLFSAFFYWLVLAGMVHAQNPIVRDQFSADPTVRVFNDKLYLFPSHDIPAPPDRGLRPNWFCMADYHVFSSENLTDWTDHGVIVSQNKVEWVDSNSFSMWAPDCVERNGKYYFYFPAGAKPKEEGRRGGFAIGVAIADSPEGPYIPEKTPIAGIMGIDPCVLIDKDGQAYIYYSMRNMYAARLKDNMVELDSEPVILDSLPGKGLKEGPFVFERNGIYYFTFPHVENTIERLEYAIGDNPMGPFKMAGVIMDESPMNCWTNHHSIFEFNGQWFLSYHQNAYSPSFDKNRSSCLDSLFFNDDGTIVKVSPTHRGVGVSDAEKPVQIDRYSAMAEAGVSVELHDTLNTFEGWKTTFTAEGAWVRYNSVSFKESLKTVQIKALSPSGGAVEIHLDKVDGPLAASITIPSGTEWTSVNANVSDINPGVHNLVIVSKQNDPVAIDWIQFLK